MKWIRNRRSQYLLAFLAVILALAILVARLSRVPRSGRQGIPTWSKIQPQETTAPPNSRGAQSNNNSEPRATPLPAPSPTPDSFQASSDAPRNLIIPVAGVRPDQLQDTFSDARSEGRVHDAIDIPAPRGTPVVAAADGKILKLSHSDRGGITVYQLSADEKFVYYYAHLDRYAEGLAETHYARQGETIAYVGDSGNAGPGNYHLHFSIATISDPKRYWEGVNINPYPLLRK